MPARRPHQLNGDNEVNIELNAMPKNGSVDRDAKFALAKLSPETKYIDADLFVTVKNDPGRCWVKKSGESTLTAHG